ncbi:hypothetical protein D3C87_1450090 [compost metagenome]
MDAKTIETALKQDSFANFLSNIMIPEKCKTEGATLPKYQVGQFTKGPNLVSLKKRLNASLQHSINDDTPVQFSYVVNKDSCKGHAVVIIGYTETCCKSFRGNECKLSYSIADSAGINSELTDDQIVSMTKDSDSCWISKDKSGQQFHESFSVLVD